MASQSGEQTRPGIFPPFSGELRVDEELKLSQENFTQAVNAIFRDKDLTPLSQNS
jgi:hypothetical protein